MITLKKGNITVLLVLFYKINKCVIIFSSQDKPIERSKQLQCFYEFISVLKGEIAMLLKKRSVAISVLIVSIILFLMVNMSTFIK